MKLTVSLHFLEPKQNRATPLVPLPPRPAANETFWIQRGPKRQILLFAL